jgi:Domain of unknown function (DUF4129)
MGGGKGSHRILVGALVGVALVAAVGVASRAHTPAGGGQARSISQDVLLEYALLLLAALAVVVVPFAIYMFITGRGDDVATKLPERKKWMPALLFSMIGLSVVSVVLLRYVHDRHGGRDNPVSQLVGLARHGTKTTGAVRFDWAPVIVVSTLVLLALAAGLWLVRERRRTEPERGEMAAELAVALERTIADLRAEPDPRTAVIAAYAQMEHALAGVGLQRRADEAPREYLGRVLPEVGAQTASVERLTGLFERAKFSPHAIDAAMKDEAIDALESLRDDLRSAP